MLLLYQIITTYSTSTDRYANVDVGVLLYHIERFPGIIILTTNLIDNMDKAFFRRLKFVLQFDCPSMKLRLQLWKVKRILICLYIYLTCDLAVPYLSFCFSYSYLKRHL